MNPSQNAYAQQQMGPPPPLHQTVSYSSQNSHNLPQTPQSQTQRPAARPTSKSGFSFHSHKSRGSSDGTPKMDLHESPAEKRARRLSTKADPRMAISEAEPSQLANDHSSSLQPLRALVHKDANGNPIVDPDRSNPTRSRWERPLDTIRAFEAAIDGNYSRKAGGTRPEADSRRTSYAASNVAPMRSYQGNGYSGGRNGGGSQAGYEGNNDQNNGYYPNRQRIPRQGNEPMQNNGYGNNGYQNGYQNGSPPAGLYPPNANQQSYETVTTASGSGSSSDRMQYGTDPSSENSSFDRMPIDERQEYAQGQGYNNYQAGSQQQAYGPGNGYQQGMQQQQQYEANAYQDQGRPAPPPKMDSVGARAPARLGKLAPPGGQQGYDSYGAPAGKEEKKKSWLGRRFSKRT